jgi:phage tail-like protein
MSGSTRRTPASSPSTCATPTAPRLLIWSIARAYLVKLTASPFDATSNDVAIESLEIQAAGISVTPA